MSSNITHICLPTISKNCRSNLQNPRATQAQASARAQPALPQEHLSGPAQEQLSGPTQEQLSGPAQEQLSGPAQEQLSGPAQAAALAPPAGRGFLPLGSEWLRLQRLDRR